MEAALDNACEQLMRENHIADVDRVKRKLARTIVALAAVGETNPTKWERMALQAYRSHGRACFLGKSSGHVKPLSYKTIRPHNAHTEFSIVQCNRHSFRICPGGVDSARGPLRAV
jgi:hypothetical protein